MSGATYYKFNMELPMLWVNLKEFDNDRLAEIIVSKGDVQNKKTNVKANMTDWRLDTEHEEVSNLANKAIELASDMRKSYSDIKYYTRSCWGAVYTKGDYTDAHAHYPCLYSWCYYVKAPKGSSPLIFTEANIEFTPTEGDLIIFSSLANHKVPPCDIEEQRIMIAGNIGVH